MKSLRDELGEVLHENRQERLRILFNNGVDLVGGGLGFWGNYISRWRKLRDASWSGLSGLEREKLRGEADKILTKLGIMELRDEEL